MTEWGQHSGHAEPESWLLPPREKGGSYVPLHVGAAVERRDEAEEVSGFLSRSRENSRASLRTNPSSGSDHQTEVAGGKPNQSRVSSDARVGPADNKA